MKRALLILSALLAGLLLSWSRAWAATAQDLLSIHRTYLNQTASQMNSATLTGNSSDYYFTSIYLMGMLSAVEADLVVDPNAADTELRQAMGYIDNMISKAVINKGHKVWDASPNELYNYQGNEPIARAAMLIMRTPAFKSKYASKATSYINFVDDSVIQRWYVTEYNSNPSWLLGDPADWGDGQKYNDKSWLLGDIVNSLYLATGNTYYLNLNNKIAAGFKAYLKALGNGWVFNYHTIPIGSDTNDEPGSVGNQEGSPDTAHVNRVPVMMAFQWEGQTGGWTLADLQRLAATLTDTCWNQSTVNPIIANYIDGSNKAYRTRMTAGSNGFIFSGWALMGRFSAKAQTLGEAVLHAIQTGNGNSTVLANSDEYYKVVGLSGHLARNVAVNQARGAPSGAASGPMVRSLSFTGAIPINSLLQADVVNAAKVQWKLTRKADLPNATPAQVARAAAVPRTLAQQTDTAALDLGTQQVAPGVYTIQVVAVGPDGSLSTPVATDVTLVDASTGETRVFPNPWRVDRHANVGVTFDRVTAGTEVDLFTIAGQLVKKLVSTGSGVTWDLSNESGDHVGSGIYLWISKNTMGQKSHGQLAIIR